MLTVAQVKAHSDIFVSQENLQSVSMARVLYQDNGRAHRLRIICPCPNPELSVESVKATIDWERFAKWINRHDDLTEGSLITPNEWVAFQSKEGKRGRDGILDTIQKRTTDCSKMVLI